MNTKILITRTLSGTVYVVLIVCAIILNKYSFAVVFAILCVCTTYEFHKLTNKQENVSALALAGMLSSFLIFTGNFLLYQKKEFDILFSIYFIFIFGTFIIEIFRKKPYPVNNIAYFLFGQIYIAVPFVFMFEIFEKYNAIFLLALFILIWANDVFAYLVGSLFGRHKLCERISPNKSWEGFLGGLAGALIAGFIFWKFNTELNLIQWLVFALIIVVFSTLGDLFESLIKRTSGVKDSGNIMPGHGGFLDRLDSILFAAPATFIYLTLIT